MKILNADRSELMEVIKLEREGSNLVISGTIMEALPIRCILTPTQARSAVRLLGIRLALFVLTMLFRS